MTDRGLEASTQKPTINFDRLVNLFKDRVENFPRPHPDEARDIIQHMQCYPAAFYEFVTGKVLFETLAAARDTTDRKLWLFTRRYQGSAMTFEDLHRMLQCLWLAASGDWHGAIEAHEKEDWPEPSLEVQMAVIEYKSLIDNTVNNAVYE